MAPMKECKKCKRLLPAAAFSLKENSKTIVACRCDECRSSAAVQWAKKNPAKMREAAERFRAKGGIREGKLRDKYGITQAQFDALLSGQGGACAICHAREPGGKWKTFHVDHDHLTGAVRGLLCTNCNRGLGYFGDDESRLKKAAAYLSQ